MKENTDLIPFNRPFVIGRELEFIQRAVESGHLSSGGMFSRHCEKTLEDRYGIKRAFLTTSCTSALEMAAILLDIGPGDEVIAPSYSFVSTVNPFALRGAEIVFADSCSSHPNMNVASVEALITPRTKAIICVHYAGMGCDPGRLIEIGNRHAIAVIEDAAHSIESKWKGKQLGTFGQMGAFSFHETKNVISGEGGLLCVNDLQLCERAEVVAQKGTNRNAFLSGRVSKYEWVDIGSSFTASELTAAYLAAQLEQLELIQKNRLQTWSFYHSALVSLEKKGIIRRPVIPEGAETNGHIYYLICNSAAERTKLIEHLAKCGIQAVFHYQSLHRSPFFSRDHKVMDLPHADRYSACLLRLPLFYGMSEAQRGRVVTAIRGFFND